MIHTPPASPNFLLALGKSDSGHLWRKIGVTGPIEAYEERSSVRRIYGGAVELSYIEAENGTSYCYKITYFFANEAKLASFQGPLPLGLEPEVTPAEMQACLGEPDSHHFRPRDSHHFRPRERVLDSWNLHHSHSNTYKIVSEMDVFGYRLSERVSLQARFHKQRLIDLIFHVDGLYDDLFGLINGKPPRTFTNFILTRLNRKYVPNPHILPPTNWNPFANSSFKPYGQVSG